MELFDTHTHLYLPEFEADRDAVMSRAIEAGVSRMMSVSYTHLTLPTNSRV